MAAVDGRPEGVYIQPYIRKLCLSIDAGVSWGDATRRLIANSGGKVEDNGKKVASISTWQNLCRVSYNILVGLVFLPRP